MKNFLKVVFALVAILCFFSCDFLTQRGKSDPDLNIIPDDSEENIGKEEVVVKTYLDYKKGDTIIFNGEEYLVTRNLFLENQGINEEASGSSEDESKSVILKYIDKYILKYWQGKDIHQQFLEEKAGIMEYIELFPNRENTKNSVPNGNIELDDEFIFLNKELRRIARIRRRWVSTKFCEFFYGISDATACNEKFNMLDDDFIREYDFAHINLYTYDVGNNENGNYEYIYNYHDEAKDATSEWARKVDYGSLYRASENLDYFKVNSNLRPSWRKELYENGQVSFSLINKSGSMFAQLKIRDSLDLFAQDKIQIGLMVYGDGKVNGSTNRLDYKNEITARYYHNYYSLRLWKDFGDPKTERIDIKSNDATYTGDVRVEFSTSTDNGSTWVVNSEETKTVVLEDIHTVTDVLDVSGDKTEINGYSVPASITYHAHFAKDENGNYPILDKYSKVTCYPEWDTTVDRIVYKVTEKSIEDFISTYKNDFVKLYTEDTSVNLEDEKLDENDTTPRFEFVASESKLKIELEDMATNFEITTDETASGQKAGELIDENSYAEAIITFPAGDYVGYVCEYAPTGNNDAFYVKFGENYVRCYASDPVPGTYELTTRTPIELSATETTTVKMKILKDCPSRTGETGMFIDYIIFEKK